MPETTMPHARTILTHARAILARADWAKGDYAFTYDGCSAKPYSPKAQYYCAVGAVMRAAWELYDWQISTIDEEPKPSPFEDALAYLQSAARRRRFMSIASLNDTEGTTLDLVLAAYDDALAELDTLLEIDDCAELI